MTNWILTCKAFTISHPDLTTLISIWQNRRYGELSYEDIQIQSIRQEQSADYEPLHPVEKTTLEAQPQLAMADVSLCLPGWITSFCDKFEEGQGWNLSHSRVNAIAHTLIAARKRQYRLIAERDDALRQLREYGQRATVNRLAKEFAEQTNEQ